MVDHNHAAVRAVVRVVDRAEARAEDREVVREVVRGVDRAEDRVALVDVGRDVDAVVLVGKMLDSREAQVPPVVLEAVLAVVLRVPVGALLDHP